LADPFPIVEWSETRCFVAITHQLTCSMQKWLKLNGTHQLLVST